MMDNGATNMMTEMMKDARAEAPAPRTPCLLTDEEIAAVRGGVSPMGVPGGVVRLAAWFWSHVLN